MRINSPERDRTATGRSPGRQTAATNDANGFARLAPRRPSQNNKATGVPRSADGHSALMPAALRIGHHLSISAV